MKKEIPGLHVQWPWSRMLVSGKKVVETRNYPLPKKYWGKPLAIIETAGKSGKKDAGITEAKIIGVVVFSRSIHYESRKAWKADAIRHLVTADDSLFGFNETKPKYGWEVQSILEVQPPKAAPRKRGIVFANGCKV